MEEEKLAKEELNMLETQYPNQYESLKLELRSFILQLQSNHHDSPLIPQKTFLPFLDTQESTCFDKRKMSNIISNNYGLELALEDSEVMEVMIDEGCELEPPMNAEWKGGKSRKDKRKDRVDLVLERAQACLNKIRHFKTTLLSQS
ncbi:hypothetical protein TanjilG_01481 [Lupinus angustifolius]|uniref:Uncharacterized protein n=1 Tax=Lupinus angustifolius TaxID=3871 RepID=A0A4P1QVL3_LUPAN|nr:PREDICTED: uncharacterized protein LOC109329509 [Lupinus angustifolius]OIV95687.1 hypothetical protein TanjilG_01481 [Lupinus angustifolius]